MENLLLDDFTKYRFLSGIKYSPDGSKIGFVLHHMDVEENKYLSNIYIYDIKTENSTKLTSQGSKKTFLFKDTNTILFPDIRDSKDKTRKEKGEDFTVYYEIPLNGGEANKAFEIPLNVANIEMLDDNNYLVTALYDYYKESLNRDLEEEKDYEVLDEIPFWSNGQGFTNKKRNRLYIYNIKENHLTPITDEFTNVDSFKLNEDKTKIILITSSFIDKMPLKSELYLYHIEEKHLEKLTHEEIFSYAYADFLEDKIIFAGTDMESYGINENNHIYLMDKSGNVNILSPGNYSLWNSVSSDCRYGSNNSIKVDGKYLYFVTTEYDSSYINRIDKTGDIEKLTIEKGSVDGFDILNGEIVFVGLRGLKLQELYKLDNYKEEQLTSFNEWVVKEKKLSTPEKITFETEKGINIEGWIMKPVDFDENKKYPGVLDIHGGPKSVYGEVFFHEMQYWTNEGYVVFYCNPRVVMVEAMNLLI